MLSAIVYTLMNPVAAGLVRRGDQWPGLRSIPPLELTLLGGHLRPALLLLLRQFFADP